MCPTDRFLIHHCTVGPVYSSETIPGVLAYLWGRDVRRYTVYAYEMPVPLENADLVAFGRKLYEVVLGLNYPHGVETALF